MCAVYINKNSPYEPSEPPRTANVAWQDSLAAEWRNAHWADKAGLYMKGRRQNESLRPVSRHHQEKNRQEQNIITGLPRYWYHLNEHTFGQCILQSAVSGNRLRDFPWFRWGTRTIIAFHWNNTHNAFFRSKQQPQNNKLQAILQDETIPLYSMNFHDKIK